MSGVSQESAPIGMFDSGLGGLTVLRRLREILPHESVLFVADQAHVPYGGRDLAEIRRFACSISTSLLEAGSKAVVMACNISSATGLEEVQRSNPNTPALGVILPGANAALKLSPTGRIGVLATEGTLRSGAYTRALTALAAQVRITEIACPKFVPLVEASREGSAEAYAASQEYLAPLTAAGVDTIILGCTHYPFLLPTLQSIAPNITFVDPASATIWALSASLAISGLSAPPSSASPTLRLITTGDVTAFSEQLLRFLPDMPDNVFIGGAFWSDGSLHFVE